MADLTYIINALGEALSSPERPPELASIRYPRRELRPVMQPDGSITVKLPFWGWEYKHRGSRPSSPPSVDPEDIRTALNTLLPDDLTITAAEHLGTHIKIQIILEA